MGSHALHPLPQGSIIAHDMLQVIPVSAIAVHREEQQWVIALAVSADSSVLASDEHPEV